MTQFMAKGCGCKKCNGRPCSLQFYTNHVQQMRTSCFALSHSELDIALLGQLSALMNTSADVIVESCHSAKSRQNSYSAHYHQGKAVCTQMFRFLHTVGNKRLKNLIRSLKNDGITTRVHGNS